MLGKSAIVVVSARHAG